MEVIVLNCSASEHRSIQGWLVEFGLAEESSQNRQPSRIFERQIPGKGLLSKKNLKAEKTLNHVCIFKFKSQERQVKFFRETGLPVGHMDRSVCEFRNQLLSVYSKKDGPEIFETLSGTFFKVFKFPVADHFEIRRMNSLSFRIRGLTSFKWRRTKTGRV